MTGLYYSSDRLAHFYTGALCTSTPELTDAAPIPDFLATMEAQLQQLLAGKETAATMTSTLQSAYASHGRGAQYSNTDGEF